MSTKRKKVIWGTGIGGFVALIIIFISIMTWYYPFSPFSIGKSYSYTPEQEKHNGKTYEEEVDEFKSSYEEKFPELATSNETVDNTRFILPIFEQNWLTDTEQMTPDKLDTIAFKVKQTKQQLLELIVSSDYTKAQKEKLVTNINSFTELEEKIRRVKNNKYYSRSELDNMLDQRGRQ
ncbi:hypothetical protein GCM10028778_20370 [Barrientosiimonas marina]|uniref:Uncharacterized protein n=1 Tax=Lentibacillus kimchii TaxID=1542911 RepID=A0ABW2UY43_9BACI